MEAFVLVQTALLKAIRYCGSKQKKLAKLIGEDPDKISYWLNRAKQIPFHQAIAIETVTNGIVSRYDLAPYAKLNCYKKALLTESSPELKISDRVYIAMYLESLLGNRQGYRNDLRVNQLQYEDNLVSKCAQLKGKTATLVAKEVGFSSRDTYLRAKKVVQQGAIYVIEAMDKKIISISRAAEISKLPLEEQKIILKKNKKEIFSYIKKINKKNGYSFYDLLKEDRLLNAEKFYKLPLRLPLMGILINCDSQGYFLWDPQKLQEDLLPKLEINFDEILTCLIKIGAIEKIYMKDTAMGKVLITMPL